VKTPIQTSTRKKKSKVDLQKQFFDGKKVGKFSEVSTSWGSIRQLHGIVMSLNPSQYRKGPFLDSQPKDPTTFFNDIVQPWISRHPTLAKAEVRNNGWGCNVILRFDKPVTLNDEQEHEAWENLIYVLQGSLPAEPMQPLFGPLVRAIGSVESESGRKVIRLAPGEPVSQDEAFKLYHDMCDRPFSTVMHIISGRDRIKPCPACKTKDSVLVAKDHHGVCSGTCGKMMLSQLYDLVFVHRTTEVFRSV
jgi:hypothetical protein